MKTVGHPQLLVGVARQHPFHVEQAPPLSRGDLRMGDAGAVSVNKRATQLPDK
jgi:hypothetical protein